MDRTSSGILTSPGLLLCWRPDGGKLFDMIDSDPKAALRTYLQDARDALVWKLEELSEYDIRRPWTPTGTNLLGLVKHVALTELGYLGETFGRPLDSPLTGIGPDTEPNVEMWATLDESRELIVDFYRQVWAHSDATIEDFALDAVVRVPWWPEDRNEVSLHRVLIHMIAETERHAGHADIVRELIDGATGLRAGNKNLPSGDQDWWREYRSRVRQVAEEVRDR